MVERCIRLARTILSPSYAEYSGIHSRMCKFGMHFKACIESLDPNPPCAAPVFVASCRRRGTLRRHCLVRQQRQASGSPFAGRNTALHSKQSLPERMRCWQSWRGDIVVLRIWGTSMASTPARYCQPYLQSQMPMTSSLWGEESLYSQHGSHTSLFAPNAHTVELIQA